tara:strand:- start:4486 stop:4932 length:447 start_codon:yes stop_codon:yes gene_type:complete
MIKKNLYAHCKNLIQEKLIFLEKQKEELQLALTSESKSSAGDKHETGRAMIQIEREKLGRQIAITEKNYNKLFALSNPVNTSLVSLGSLVITDKANYYILISVESYLINSKIYYCISSQSPIGKLLLGKKVKDQINFNQNISTILEIL